MKVVIITLAGACLSVLTPCAGVHAKGAKAGGKAGMPSEQLDPMLEKALAAILEPLERDPKMPRVEVEKLRASFAGGEVKAVTPASKQIHQNAMAVCDSLTKGMDDRASSKAAAIAASKTPTLSNGGGIIKSSPIRGFDAGANAEAIRKKQKDERKYEDKRAGAQAGFADSAAYRAWTEKSTLLRKNVMALYTRQVQLEAAAEAPVVKAHAEAPVAKSDAPPVKSVPKTTAAISSNDKLAIGRWIEPEDDKPEHVLKADHTCTRHVSKNDSDFAGRWEWMDEKKRLVHITFSGGGAEFEVTFSEDGKSASAHNIAKRSKGKTVTWKRAE